VRFGPKCEEGALPVYSVGSEKEAMDLLVMTCPTNLKGEFVAPDLVLEQTLENLDKFAERLDRAHKLVVKAGRCSCSTNRKEKHQ
jgi:hypothetical protein